MVFWEIYILQNVIFFIRLNCQSWLVVPRFSLMTVGTSGKTKVVLGPIIQSFVPFRALPTTGDRQVL